MRKTNLLNTKLSSAISEIGHTQWLTIGDSGLPIANDGRKIDLSVIRGLPSFISVLAATLSEMKVQRVFLAEEIKSDNVEQHRAILDLLDTDVEVVYIAHDELKK